MIIEPQAIEQLTAAVNKQTELLAEAVTLLRKREERQARADRVHEMIREAQMRSPVGSLVSAMKARASANAEAGQ